MTTSETRALPMCDSLTRSEAEFAALSYDELRRTQVVIQELLPQLMGEMWRTRILGQQRFLNQELKRRELRCAA